MTAEHLDEDAGRKSCRYQFDRHTADYRHQFEAITEDMHARCPIAWSDTYGGHWVAAGSNVVFELARSPHVSNDHDIHGERRGYQGIGIPLPKRARNVRGSMLEMDDPEHRVYRNAVNPYLSPAAVARWVPLIDEVVRASLDDHIELGRIDFVDHLANVVPAVLTLAMLGIPLKNWELYSEAAHAAVYTPEHSPDLPRVTALHQKMGMDLAASVEEIRAHPRPGIVNALMELRIDGEPVPIAEVRAGVALVIGGGFDTTTALTAHALEWLSQHPEQRTRLSRERVQLLAPATEEFLRYFTPAPGDGRTISADFEVDGTRFVEGERLWLSWAMANRDPAVFPDPGAIVLDRRGNRHFSFGIGVHRCVGSNVARTVFKAMLTAVLDRLPDYNCDPGGTVHYDTVGVIQGMRQLPATFTPGVRLGPGLEETLEVLQEVCDDQGAARPVTEHREPVHITKFGGHRRAM